MKYDHNLPDDSVNAPDEAWWKQVLKLGFSIIFVVVIIGVGSHFLGHIVGPIIPGSVHKKLSNYYSKAFGDISDQKSARFLYTQRIFQEILDQKDLDHEQWEIRQVQQEVVAATLPGKIIVFSDKLFDFVCHENALGFIISHEIGHAYLKHPELAFGKLLPSLVLNFVFNIDVGNDVLQSLSSMFDLKVSRTREKAADEFAKKLALARYGHLDGADEFFQRHLEEEGKSGPHEWFSTHPDTIKRIEAINSHYGQDNELIPIPENVRSKKCNIFND